MSNGRTPRFRATRTTPDPYPPHPVLVFTDKDLAAAMKASGLPVRDFNGFEEMAFGSELSDWIDLREARFTATLEPSGEECLVYGHHMLDELTALDPTECIEIGHRSGEGPKQMVPRGQVVGITEGAPLFVEDIVSAPIADDLIDVDGEPLGAPVRVSRVRSAMRRFGRSS